METVGIRGKDILPPDGSLAGQAIAFVRRRVRPAWLVGGYVRDQLLGRLSHDLDLVVLSDALALARSLANAFSGAFYPLDEQRDTGRVILRDWDGSPLEVDVARARGGSLEADLALRDFTVNALAVDLHHLEAPLVDLHNGLADLQAGLLRAVAQNSFRDDPARTLRAVRLSAHLGWRIEERTAALIRRDAGRLINVSGERIRDELVQILRVADPAAALQLLDGLGLTLFVLPEMADLKGVTQSPPHHQDVFGHTLEVMRQIRWVLDVARGANLMPVGVVSGRSEPAWLVETLTPFVPALVSHLQRRLSGERTVTDAVLWSALCHDWGKPETRSVDEEAGGRIRFLGHEKAGARLARERLRLLRFSRAEVERVATVSRNHMRPLLLARHPGYMPSRRAIYRYFRDTGDAGIDTCLVALADHLAIYGLDLEPDRWHHRLRVIAALMDSYFYRKQERVSPPPLVRGRDLMDQLGVKQGPLLGKLLEAIREAQAAGELHSRDEALELAQRLMSE
ncbi:MAG TPA: CCA tRNA nucleotidyltransferase [Anaerolineae bacterium]|nr:CCA tRNA nucleotidyltransferase [Anaerolineae bacterium]